MTEMSTRYRKDYQPPTHVIDRVKLTFDLDPVCTEVVSELSIRRARDYSKELFLDGEALELIEISLDDVPLKAGDYALDPHGLRIFKMPGQGRLRIRNRIHPQANTQLSGLYLSGEHLVTQCEAEGFRRITYFLDRPDVMSVFEVVLRAHPQDYPVLLSNGNLVESATLDDGRQQVHWHDPFPKPCYLFALVAGQLVCNETSMQTRSGREVLLQVWTEPDNLDKTQFALESLQRAIRWDEKRFGLELDLDRYMIVAVRNFNMGAMENKGLNIFNAAYVLANPAIATDVDYANIESIVGHEYFHNWTGNRVTCRDWFQLTLKEGLTVFRDQLFSEDMLRRDSSSNTDAHSYQSLGDIRRIEDVEALQTQQFSEDAGPMAHPIRPESYQEIGNFYTTTVYEKGAEVIRMLHTLLGEVDFQRAISLYFERYDGQAVTCDDFLDVMETLYKERTGGADLSVFRRWYSQAGTPTVKIECEHDASAKRLSIRLQQSCPPVGVETTEPLKTKQAFHIPIAFCLLDAQGQPLAVRLDSNDEAAEPHTQHLLQLTTSSTTVQIADVDTPPTPCWLQGFSAPVRIEYNYSEDALITRSLHDPDGYGRWDAIRKLIVNQLRNWLDKKKTANHEPEALLKVWDALLKQDGVEPGLLCHWLTLPDERWLADEITPIDPLAIHHELNRLRNTLATTFSGQWETSYRLHSHSKSYRFSPSQVGNRSMRRLCLEMMLSAGTHHGLELACQQYDFADNMTDRLNALTLLVRHRAAANSSHVAELVQNYLEKFLHAFRDEPSAMDKWFAVQARAPDAGVASIRDLMNHTLFTLHNPNRVRSVFGAFFMQNPAGFHGNGPIAYDFWREQILRLDTLNPELSARLARALDRWRDYIEPVRTSLGTALRDLSNHANLSPNTREIISKALEVNH